MHSLERKLVNASNCYPILDLGFKGGGEKAGTQGVSFRQWGVRTLQEGLGRVVSGFLAAFGDPARPCRSRPARQPPANRLGWDGCLEGGGKAKETSAIRGPAGESCGVPR